MQALALVAGGKMNQPLTFDGEPVETADGRPVLVTEDGYEYVGRHHWTREERMLKCGIPEKYVYPPVPYEKLEGIDKFKRTLQCWDRRKWIVISGHVASGKTTLMAEIARRTSERYTWRNWYEICKRVKLSWDKNNDEREESILRELKRGGILFLDDLGKGALKDKKEGLETIYTDMAYEIFGYRYDNNLVTVLTSEHKGGKLQTGIGEASISRIMHESIFVDLDYQPEWRITNRKRRF